MRRALQAILIIGLAGLSFSGVLVYREVFGGAAGCGTQQGGTQILGLPVCVYGFSMFLLITIVAALGLWSSRSEEYGTPAAPVAGAR